MAPRQLKLRNQAVPTAVTAPTWNGLLPADESPPILTSPALVKHCDVDLFRIDVDAEFILIQKRRQELQWRIGRKVSFRATAARPLGLSMVIVIEKRS